MSNRADAPSPLVLADLDAWREWLLRHEESHDGTWLTLAKKGVTAPTSLSYQAALEEALCGGWIDGQRKSLDAHTFQQRFTPRRSASMWSQRNVDLVARLIDEGRMRPRGFAEIERAQADGRWERAYAGQASVEMPAELAAALGASPEAQAAFDALGKAERYSVLHPIITAPNAATKASRIDRAVTRLKS